MEPNKSSHLTNDKVIVAGEYCAGQTWHKLLYKSVQVRWCLIVDGMTALQGVGGCQELQ